MEVIGVGMGRTGTTSIQQALERLGYRAYNFEAVVREDHFDAWRRLAEGTGEPDWPALFGGYDATISWPACFFYKELMEVYPDARFILTTRDPESWAESVVRTSKVIATVRTARFIPRARKMTALMDALMVPVLGGFPPEKERAISAFKQHNAAARAYIPPEKLLVYEAKEGWEPLCDFLNRPVPGGPFPYENQGDTFIRQALQRFIFGQTGNKQPGTQSIGEGD
ncbi:MAG: sulfotransferase family protein [Rubrobacteraceae bacterium]